MLQAKLREAIASYRRGAYTPATSPGTRPSSRAATAASRRKSVAPQGYAPPAPAPAAGAPAAAAGGAGGYNRSHTPSRSSSCASLADSVAEAQAQQPSSYAPGASAATGAGGGGGGAVRKGRKSMAGLPLRVTEGAGGYTSQLSSIPDGHAAAALPGEWACILRCSHCKVLCGAIVAWASP